MESGWTISITDNHAKDKVYKSIKGDRSLADLKVEEYQKRYDAIEMGRFKVSIDSQYSEFTLQTIKLGCVLRDGCSIENLQDLLSLFDIFIDMNMDAGHTYSVEIPLQDKELVSQLLQQSEYLSELRLL